MNRRVLSNAAVLAALKIGAPLSSLLLIGLLSRRLGLEELGRYSLGYSWLALTGLLGLLGMPALLTREGARNPSQLGNLLAGAAALGGLASLVLAAGMALGGFLLAYDPKTLRVVAILSLAVLPSTLLTYAEAAFLGLEEMAPLIWTSLGEHLLKVGLGIGLLYAGYGLGAVLGAAVAGRLAACGIALHWLRRLGVSAGFPRDTGLARKLASEAPVFALSAICATLYWRIDVFLLTQLKGVAEVGLYTAAYRVLDLAILLPQSLCQALFPHLAARGGQDGEAAIRWLLVLTAPVALGATLAPARLLEQLYGPGFQAAVPLLVPLVWTALPYAWNRYYATILIARGRQRTDLAINAGLLALNVALNLALIPPLGARGAALVTLVTALLYTLAQRIALRRSGPAAAVPEPQPLHASCD
jgi:O-antigen/teichoic acid export membrane protein